MFRFANYVFGLENVDNNANQLDVNDVTQTNVDDDWILIDIENNANNGSNGYDGNEAKENNNAMQNEILAQNDKTTTYTVPNTAKNAQLLSPLYSSSDCDDDNDDTHSQSNDDNASTDGNIAMQAIAMEDSWLVTPPPCFNSQLANAVIVETNPFENLLIEHPSMSVFGPQMTSQLTIGRNRLYFTPHMMTFELSSSSSSSSSSLPSLVDIISSSSSSSSSTLSLRANHNHNNNQQIRQTPRQQRYQQQQQLRNNINQSNVNITSNTANSTNFKLISSSQSAELAYISKTLTKSSLDRQNKAKSYRNDRQNRRLKMSIRPNGSFSKRSNNC